jgi:1,4-alpha-glucan branching enzyme
MFFRTDMKRMKKLTLFFSLCVLVSLPVVGQVVTTSPAVPNPSQPVTITFDVTGTDFATKNLNDVWLWAWVLNCSSSCDAPTNVNPATAAQNAAKVTRSVINPNVYSIIITPTTFFNKSANDLVGANRIGVLLKGSDWGLGQTADRFITFSVDFALTISQPSEASFFVNNGQVISIQANTNQASDITVKVNSSTVATSTGQVTTFTHPHTVTETFGSITVSVEANNGIETKTSSFVYTVRGTVVNQARPAGIRDGINYGADPTKVTLSFLAPLKTSVYAIGDFTNWQIDGNYQMKKDGEHFWVEITGLTPGQEYAFQYLVDETIKVADPFADKLLDPNNDQFITATTYPALKPYPAGASGIVSVLQTAQTPYVWQTVGYQRPAKEKLNVYELLVRDFDTPRSFQAVIDRLDYFKTLGINAIELMPIMEFSGNDSWGYNPIFYFGVDKAYGTKNKLKELIDKAHAKGIAVILDMVLNQADYEFPYVKMYWAGSKPAANNPWFNQDATHPFSVFFDFNHESSYTKSLVDTINHYWLSEYKFDGFRFDLSKGFTQTVNTDVGAWGRKDQSRINILTRMANKIWSVDPDAYVILEHFADDDEEVILTNSGMMVWGNMTGAYKQSILGFSSGSDISRTYYKNRSGGTWNNAGSVIGFMESHDEERMIYEAIHSGNSVTGYNVRVLNTALDRAKGALTFLFSVPGPKMIWQFGELGYDFSINTCSDGTTVNNNCRTGAKPIRWDYATDDAREKLYKTVSEFLALRNSYSVFHTSDVVISGGNDLYKQVTLKNNPYTDSPASANEMNVVVIGNFDVTQQSRAVTFPHTGTWYHFFSRGDELNVNATSMSINLQPGEFRVYTDVMMESTETELMSFVRPLGPELTSVLQANGVVNLTWVDNSQIETGYRIYRKKSSSSTYTLLGQQSANQTNFVDTSLEPLTEYDYYVEAFNSTGNDASETLSITTTEDVITSIEADELRNASIYPNPGKDLIMIDLPEGRNYLINMVDVNGRVVNRLSSQTNEYNVSGVKAGLYFIRISSKKSVRYFRFIKL